MFEQTFVNGTKKTNKPLTVVLSLTLQVLAISALILIPLVYTQALPNAELKSLITAPAPPRPAPPNAHPAKAQARAVIRQLDTRQLVAPAAIPKRLNVVKDYEPPPDVDVFGSNGGTNGGNNSIVGVIGADSDVAPPPPHPAQSKPKPPGGPVRIGTLSEADLIRKVQPVYPPLAKSARIQGIVEFKATISKEGNIEDLQLMRGHPLLVKAAKEAILKWKYRPTLLNGQPVEVITDIIVDFTLTQ